MNREVYFAEIVGRWSLLSVYHQVFLLTIVICAKMLPFDILLEVYRILGAASCWKMTHYNRHSLHVIHCQIGVRYR